MVIPDLSSPQSHGEHQAGRDSMRASLRETASKTGRAKDNEGDEEKIIIKSGNQLCDINELVQNTVNEHCHLSGENCQLKKEIKIYKSLCEKQVRWS